MKAEEQSQHWQQVSQPVFVKIAKWREAHPHATMAEIEQAVDEQMQSLRAQVLQEAAQERVGKEPFVSSPYWHLRRSPDREAILQRLIS